MKAYPLVQILWRDAADEKETWMKTADIDEEDYEVMSIGFLVRETAKYLTLAGDQVAAEEDAAVTWGRITRIPVLMVVERHTLVKGDSL